MRFSQLRNLLALTEHASLGSAAAALNITQPVLTRSIQTLEVELGVKLVERSARGTRLTPEGERLAARARRIEREIAQAQEEVEQWRGIGVGSVSIGVSPVALVLLLPKAISLFRREYPRVRVNIADGLFPQVLSKLDERLLDFVVGPFPAGDAATDYHVEELFTGEMAVFARAGHPLSGETTLARLTGANWISGGPIQGPGDIIEATFASLGLTPPIPIMHCDSAISALEFVASSDLLSMLPRRLIEVSPMRSAIELIPVQEAMSPAKVHLVRRKDVIPTPAVQALQAAIRLRARAI